MEGLLPGTSASWIRFCRVGFSETSLRTTSTLSTFSGTTTSFQALRRMTISLQRNCSRVVQEVSPERMRELREKQENQIIFRRSLLRAIALSGINGRGHPAAT